MVANLSRIEGLAVTRAALPIARFALGLDVKFDRRRALLCGNNVVATLLSRHPLSDHVAVCLVMIADRFSYLILAEHLVRLA